jgi:flagellar hook protein FlgE
MSLSSALFSGISGLSTLGNAMTVIGDNIANVNTVGFKGSRVTFQDVLSQTVATTAGTAQVGRGTSLADISSSFSQGSFESTEVTTDLAVGGEGFFVVRDATSEENEFYTRSGQFRFDKDGNFVTPAGYIVRGWFLDPDTGEDQGLITDIVLQSFTSSPKKTDKITVITNLDADISSKAASLSNSWDGTATTPIVTTAYEYQSTLKAYDTLGSTHDITIYYDKISGSDWEYIVTCSPGEDKRSGFASTTSAGLLARGAITFSVGSGTISDLDLEILSATGHEQSISVDSVTNGGAGTLAAGDVNITVNDYGAMTVDTPTAPDTPLVVTMTPIVENLVDDIVGETATAAINIPAEADESVTGIVLEWDLPTTSWSVTNDGGFTGSIIVNVATDTATNIDLQLGGSGTDDITITVTGAGAGVDGEEVTFDIDHDNWQVSDVPAAYSLSDGDNIGGSQTGFTLDLDGGGTDITVTLDTNAVLNDAVKFDITGSGNWTIDTANANGYFEFSPDFLGGVGTSMDIEFDLGVRWDGLSTFIPEALTATQFSSASTTTFQSANGYGAGDLQSVNVATDGAITGQYSNGQVLPLYRVSLAKFQNNQGLFKVGGNLYRETRLSGNPITGKPGSSGLGSLSPNSLEQSNVDIATEFVKMITTQRGFQANSKIITVTDQMLAELINLKR